MWFHPSSVAELCDDATFARGLQVYRNQCVLSFDVVPLGGSGWMVSGEVIGTERRPYHVEVELALMPDGLTVDRWRSHCSCPVGLQCKHAVALLVKAAYRAKPEGVNTQPVSQEAIDRQRAEREQSKAMEALKRQRNAQLQQAERWLLADPEGGGLHKSGANPRHPSVRAESPIYMLYQRQSDGARAPLRLTLGTSSVKVKGGWTKPRVVSVAYFNDSDTLYRNKIFDLIDADREALELMAALPSGLFYHGFSGEADRLLNGVAASMVLQRAALTGRLFWRDDDGSLGALVNWGPGSPLQWQWQQQDGLTPDEPLWQLFPRLPQTQAVLCGNRPQLLYVDLVNGLCGPVEADPSAPDLLQAPPLPQPVMLKHQAALAKRLGEAVPMPPVLPTLQRVGGKPLWRLHVSLVTDSERDDGLPDPGLLTAQLDFDYQGHQGWWPPGTPRQVMLATGGQRVLLSRDLDAERQALDRLHGLGLEEWIEGVFALPSGSAPTPWLDWAEAEFEPFREAGFEVSMDADLRHWVRDGGELQVHMQARDAQGLALDEAGDDSVSDPPHWFDLSLGLEVDGARIDVLPWLPKLIHSLRGKAQEGATQLPARVHLPAPNGHGFIRVATASLQPWLEALLELFDDRRTGFEGGSVRLSRIDALRTRMALGEGALWNAVPQLGRLAEQLQGRAELPATPLPQGLKAELRPYQHQGLDWLQFLREHGLGGILADDMGLGKTLQTLAHIQCEKEAGRLDRPALVVAPVSLMGNWQREAARFCPGLNTLVLHGADRHDRADAMAQADLVIVPYSLLQRDRDRWLNQPWHVVVLDEAQNIKNAHTQAAQVVNELNTRHRLCLSGTPIENHLGEIWSLFHFLMPGFLGSQAKFQQRFRTPIEKHGNPERLAQLRARLTPFILRRTKQLVASELPPKVESVITVELSGKQADLYETIRLSMEKAVRDAISIKGLSKSQIVFLDALLKLRQVCCDPRLVKTAAAAKVKASAKLDQLMEMLPEMLAEGRRVLLFSQFTSMLSLIEAELKKRQIPWIKLTGQTQNRDEVIDTFTRGDVPLFLISLKAGGVGLNLPQADTVIHFDPWWNPAAENQATDRAHRIGQTQSVWVIKLVAQGTIEERILALQDRKAELARELYSGSVGRKQPTFTEDDVRELLKPIA
jgi:superfamily II DNA or RNA helicase